jgi:outer membrane protein
MTACAWRNGAERAVGEAERDVPVGRRAGRRKMKELRKSGVAVVLAAVLVVPGVCMAQGGVAVVQMDKVVRAFPEAQRAEETLKTVRDEYEKELEKMDAKGKELQQAVESAAAEANDKAVSEAERDKRQEAARQKWSVYQEYQQKIRKTRSENQRDLADQEMRQFKRVIGKLQEIIGEYAAEKKIDVVLDAAGVGMHGGPFVLYSSDKLDITDAIVKRVEGAGKKAESATKKTESSGAAEIKTESATRTESKK